MLSDHIGKWNKGSDVHANYLNFTMSKDNITKLDHIQIYHYLFVYAELQGNKLKRYENHERGCILKAVTGNHVNLISDLIGEGLDGRQKLSSPGLFTTTEEGAPALTK